MARILLVVLAVWVALVALGWIVKGLFWLAVVGVLFLIGTAVFGASRRR